MLRVSHLTFCAIFLAIAQSCFHSKKPIPRKYPTHIIRTIDNTTDVTFTWVAPGEGITEQPVLPYDIRYTTESSDFNNFESWEPISEDMLTGGSLTPVPSGTKQMFSIMVDLDDDTKNFAIKQTLEGYKGKILLTLQWMVANDTESSTELTTNQPSKPYEFRYTTNSHYLINFSWWDTISIDSMILEETLIQTEQGLEQRMTLVLDVPNNQILYFAIKEKVTYGTKGKPFDISQIVGIDYD